MRKTIYKFFRINEYLFDLLISNQLYFSAISQFNDPYDSKFAIEELPTLEVFEKFCSQFSNEMQEKYLASFKEDPYKCLEPLFNSLRSNLDYLGICCFSQLKDNFLMWSHYANSHKGVCLGFDLEILKKQFTQFDFVDYDDQPFFFDINDIPNSVTKAILRKSKDWEYEKEIRFLMERSKTVYFPMEALTEINFGIRTPIRQMMNIIYLVDKLGYGNCTFNQAGISDSKFNLVFEKVDDFELKIKVSAEGKHLPFEDKIDLYTKQ